MCWRGGGGRTRVDGRQKFRVEIRWRYVAIARVRKLRLGDACIVAKIATGVACAHVIEKLARCGTVHDAREIVQEAFLRVYKGIATFEGSSSFFTWLYRIVTNLAAWVPIVNPREAVVVSRRVGNVQANTEWGVLIDQMWVR